MKHKVNVRYDKGISLIYKGKKIYFDSIGLPNSKPDIIIFSHLHSDHFNYRIINKLCRNTLIVMSKTSKHILEGIYRINNPNIIGVEDLSEHEFIGLHFKFTPSGHCAGSIQTKISDDIDIVYTGDINIEPRLILNPPSILKSDVLIIEATYGHPSYIFPDRTKIYRNILKEAKRRLEEDRYLIIGSRTLGTSQELTALFSYSKLGKNIYVHKRVYMFNKIHEREYEPLGNYMPLKKNIDKNGIIIEPLNIAFKEINSSKLICTGWAIKWKNGYPLSSHSDFNHLIKYVNESRAEKVYTIYGFSKIFAMYLKNRYDINAYFL